MLVDSEKDIQYFNSHPHEEDDNISWNIVFTFVYFNSHPHEEDDGISHIISGV